MILVKSFSPLHRKQTEDVVAALSIILTPEEIAFLEELYVPHQVIGFQ